MRFLRSDFIAEKYAFSRVLPNFGIAIAARMPMMTTTINNSINVKPLRSVGTENLLQRRTDELCALGSDPTVGKACSLPSPTRLNLWDTKKCALFCGRIH